MKKTILTLLFVSLLSLGYYLNVYTPKQTQAKTKETQKNSPNTQVASTLMIEEQIQQSHPQSGFSMEETGEEAMMETIKKTIQKIPIETPMESVMETEKKDKILFEEESIDDMKLIHEHMLDVVPVGAVRMPQGVLAKLEVGDTVLLPSIDGISYALKVTSRTVSNTGSVSLDGNYMENAIIYRSILTEGENVAFISMTTPVGTYEVELKDGLGYIYATSDIENAKIDYTKSHIMKEHDMHHKKIHHEKSNK